MATEHLLTEWLLDQGRNKWANLRFPRIQWKLKHNVAKFMRQNESCVKRTAHTTKWLK